jgi:hypothetical protein
MNEFQDGLTVTFGLPDAGERTQLPKAFQPKQVVKVCFAKDTVFNCCTIIKVHYTNKHVSYDLEAACTHPTKGIEHYPRLYNVDAEFVFV